MAYGLFFRVLLTFVLLSQAPFFIIYADIEIPETFLLPEHHPIKPQLDQLFSSSRVILNLNTLEEAGFVFSKPRKFTNLIIGTHPAFPGYIFKLYLDAQRHHKNRLEHYFWILRLQGAHLVGQEIETNNLHSFLKVPQKWIYKLPKKPLPRKGYVTKHTILVEEDMMLLSKEDNEKLWASDAVTVQHLEAVYHVLKKVGLSDCAKPDNIPFSIDGRIAFIDTQTHGGHVSYEHLNDWLSSENQVYWRQLYE